MKKKKKVKKTYVIELATSTVASKNYTTRPYDKSVTEGFRLHSIIFFVAQSQNLLPRPRFWFLKFKRGNFTLPRLGGNTEIEYVSISLNSCIKSPSYVSKDISQC